MAASDGGASIALLQRLAERCQLCILKPRHLARRNRPQILNQQKLLVRRQAHQLIRKGELALRG